MYLKRHIYIIEVDSIDLTIGGLTFERRIAFSEIDFIEPDAGSSILYLISIDMRIHHFFSEYDLYIKFKQMLKNAREKQRSGTIASPQSGASI